MEENQVLNFIKQAFELKEQKYYKPAIEMLYKALETENNNVEILYQIGELYYLLNNYDRALQYLEKALTLNNNHELSQKLLCKINENTNNLDSALSIAQKLFENNENSKNLKSVIKILIKLKLYTEIEKYENSQYFNEEVKIECANALYSNGEIQKAKEYGFVPKGRLFRHGSELDFALARRLSAVLAQRRNPCFYRRSL